MAGPSGHKVNPGSGRKKSGSSRKRSGTNRCMAVGPSEEFKIFQMQNRKKSGDQLNVGKESKRIDSKRSRLLGSLCDPQELSGMLQSIHSNPHTEVERDGKPGRRRAHLPRKCPTWVFHGWSACARLSLQTDPPKHQHHRPDAET